MSTPRLADVLRSAATSMASDISTALPGRVALWDPALGLATVEAGVRRPLRRRGGGVEFEDLPLIPGVPLAFPGAPGQGLSWVPLPGDPVLLIVSQWDPSGWSGGAPADPVDLREHHWGHAFAIPIRLDAPTTPLSMVIGGALIQLGSESAALPVALAALVLAELNRLVLAINTHTHLGVVAGTGVSGTVVPAQIVIPATSVASTKVMADG